MLRKILSFISTIQRTEQFVPFTGLAFPECRCVCTQWCFKNCAGNDMGVGKNNGSFEGVVSNVVTFLNWDYLHGWFTRKAKIWFCCTWTSLKDIQDLKLISYPALWIIFLIWTSQLTRVSHENGTRHTHTRGGGAGGGSRRGCAHTKGSI